MILIIVIIAIIICMLFILYKSYKEKFKYLNIKIKSIEEKINSTLIKRKELIKDSEELIKDIVKTDKQIFEGLTNINNKNISMIELDRRLQSYTNEFYLIESKYKKLGSDKRFQKILFAMGETEDLLTAYKEYYNNTAEDYNKAIRQFPIVIISKLKKKKEKLFFDEKKINDNDYNIK